MNTYFDILNKDLISIISSLLESDDFDTFYSIIHDDLDISTVVRCKFPYLWSISTNDKDYAGLIIYVPSSPFQNIHIFRNWMLLSKNHYSIGYYMVNGRLPAGINIKMFYIDNVRLINVNMRHMAWFIFFDLLKVSYKPLNDILLKLDISMTPLESHLFNLALYTHESRGVICLDNMEFLVMWITPEIDFISINYSYDNSMFDRYVNLDPELRNVIPPTKIYNILLRLLLYTWKKNNVNLHACESIEEQIRICEGLMVDV